MRRSARGAGLGACRVAVAGALLVALLGARDVRAGQSAESLFASTGIDSVHVSPNGLWIAAVARRGKDRGVLIQRLGSDEVVGLPIFQSIWGLAWESADALIYRSLSSSDQTQTNVTRLRFVDGKIVTQSFQLAGWGELVDALPMAPEEVLWSVQYGERTFLFRVTLSELLEDPKEDEAKFLKLTSPIARIRGPASDWVVDREGRPRAAIRIEETGSSLMVPAPITGAFEAVYHYGDLEDARQVIPVGLTAEGRRLVVMAYNGRNTRGLYEFDETRRAPGPALFVHDQHDVRGVVRDPLTGDLIAAVYDVNGVAHHHYFPEYRDRFLSKLPEAWRRPSIRILNGTADRQVFVFSESSETEPGTFYARDRSGQVKAIGRALQGVDRNRLASVRSFRVKSTDDIDVEAYLTSPRDRKGPVPLVVMPHGGPAGVRDFRDFDPLVQYLASWGLAVLQVNFRGSSGFGLEHEIRGRKQRARGIEDDIDAAVAHATTLPEIDASRLCIMGASYGGFSALVSTIRHPDRFRCAVSIAGVSDVPLRVLSSDTSDSKSGVAFLEAHIGDPEKDRAELLEISPAYHADEILTPILLIQATEDRRVDRDHAHRMAMMLELYGKEFEMMEIEGAGHQLDPDEWIIVARAMRRFMTSRLLPGTPFEPDPEK